MNLILKKIYTVFAFLSFFALMGTAGASDAGNITLLQSIIQSTLSLIAFGVFTKLAGGFEPCYMEEKYTDNIIAETGKEDEQQKVG